MRSFKILLAALLLIMMMVVPSSGNVRLPRAENLTLEEKVGQIMMCSFRGPVLSDSLKRLIADLKVGGVILYSSWGNTGSAEEVADLCDSMQELARTSGTPPLFIAVDQEGGLVNRISRGATIFPGNMALGAAGDEELAARAASDTARELSAMGINMNFSPVADVNNNPHNPVIGVRSFGSSPTAVGKLASAMAKAFLEEGIIPTGKHFPGHGDTDTDSHTRLPVISSDKKTLEAIELYPFRALVNSGVPTIMTAHIMVPALDSHRPATLSRKILGMLRDDLGFDGVIITDSLGMSALQVYGTTAETAIEAFLAGADILLFGADRDSDEQDQFKIYHSIVEACRDGRISKERLDEAVSRIMTLKEDRIHRRPALKPRKAGDFQEAESAFEVAAKSVTLVRGWEKAVSKIEQGESIPLIWPANRAEAGMKLADACPFFTFYPVSSPSDQAELSSLLEKLKNEPVIFAAEYDCWKDKYWLDILKTLDEKRLFILSARTPYSLLSLPESGGFFALYHDGKPTIEALAAILNGGASPQGRLPVELPGHYPLGWGEESFFRGRD